MRSSHALRVAVAAMLVSQAALAQESKTEEVVVTSTALRAATASRLTASPMRLDTSMRRLLSRLTVSTSSRISSRGSHPGNRHPLVRALRLPSEARS